MEIRWTKCMKIIISFWRRKQNQNEQKRSQNLHSDFIENVDGIDNEVMWREGDSGHRHGNG